ncbi:MAG: choice-of-anchor D domain-containing protein [Verrucomicrobiota bacterium]
MGIDHVSMDAALTADGIIVSPDVALSLTGAVQMFELTISNASQDTSRTINQIEITGDSASKFTIDTELPLTIEPNGQQTVAYTFDSMGELGAVSANFVIGLEELEEVSVALAGTIHDPVLAPVAAIDFGESESSVSLPLEISNTGRSQDLVIESITSTGNGASAFSATNPGTIAAGAQGESSVTFAPPEPGTYSAVLVITSNDPLSPVTEIMVTGSAPSEETLIWTVGLPGDGWPQDLGMGGGPETIFVQESGTNDLPGEPDNSTMARMSDDDYYFAGVYSTVLDGGNYEPLGTVENNEVGAERAFAGTDNTLRYHFNLPDDITLGTPLSVSWDANNLHTDGQDDPRYGVEVYFNGFLVAEETVIRGEQLGVINSTPSFTIDDVNGETGEGFDNYIELRGINYNAEGGGNWMGLDHVSLVALPEDLFEITMIDRADGNVSLTWLSKSGRFYAVDTSTDLVSWETVITDFPEGGATGDETSFTESDRPAGVTDPRRFYRVRRVPPPPLYATDFEAGADGWMAFMSDGETVWELGTPNADGITTASSGIQAWGTNLAGDYTPGASARLRSPVIDVSGGSERLSLEFNYFNDTTLNLEGTVINFLDEDGSVLVSLNGPDQIISGQTDGWQPYNVGIPTVALGGNIIIEFQFLSDGDDEVGAGIYIDDVKID